jgi:hypothetical protein
MLQSSDRSMENLSAPVYLMLRGIGRSLDCEVGFGPFFEMKERIRAMHFADRRHHYLRGVSGQTWMPIDLDEAQIAAQANTF